MLHLQEQVGQVEGEELRDCVRLCTCPPLRLPSARIRSLTEAEASTADIPEVQVTYAAQGYTSEDQDVDPKKLRLRRGLLFENTCPGALSEGGIAAGGSSIGWQGPWEHPWRESQRKDFRKRPPRQAHSGGRLEATRDLPCGKGRTNVKRSPRGTGRRGRAPSQLKHGYTWQGNSQQDTFRGSARTVKKTCKGPRVEH